MTNIWYCKFLLQLSGGIELNPGPKTNYCKIISIYHWNLYSITSYNFIKNSLLTVYNSIYKFGIIFLSETYLNSETLSNDKNLNVLSYNLISAGHPSNSKRGGACIYFKESLPLTLCNISYLNECISFDILISNKLCNLISLFRSHSQSSGEFDNFVYNLHLTLEALTQKNSFLTAIIWNFNAKFNEWCSVLKTTPEGAKLNNLTPQYGLTQLSKELTHICYNYKSCIYSIFKSWPNLVIHFDKHLSLHENCPHCLIYIKSDLKMFYPPTYERTVWHYQQAGTDLIKRSLENFDWQNTS